MQTLCRRRPDPRRRRFSARSRRCRQRRGTPPRRWAGVGPPGHRPPRSGSGAVDGPAAQRRAARCQRSIAPARARRSARDLAHPVLSLANALRALWARWIASPATSGPPGPAAPAHPAQGTADPGRGARVAHVGLRADRRPPGSRVRDARGPRNGAAAPAPVRPAAPAGSPGAARAPQCRDLWAAHRADAAAARPGARGPQPPVVLRQNLIRLDLD